MHADFKALQKNLDLFVHFLTTSYKICKKTRDVNSKSSQCELFFEYAIFGFQVFGSVFWFESYVFSDFQ